MAVGCGSSSTDSDVADSDVTVASLNVLHGASCAESTAFCRLEDRLALTFRWLKQIGCPDIVALQEVSDSGAKLIPNIAANKSKPRVAVHSQQALPPKQEIVETDDAATCVEQLAYEDRADVSGSTCDKNIQQRWLH